jgi:hypothetical protein
MTRIAIVIAAGLALAALLPTLPAQAQNTRSFVSGLGSDSNSCTLAAPCRSFQHAHDQTNAGGEIAVLDTAGYGAMTITKSISIVNPGGVEAGIAAVSGGNAITINPSTSATVTLRGLTLEGSGVGQNGIVLSASAPGTLNIIDCVVKDFTGDGILVTPMFSGSVQNENVLIAKSFVLNNATNGIEISPQSSHTEVIFTIDQTTAAGNGTGTSNAGILVNSGAGLLDGTLSSIHAAMNSIGLSFTGTGSSFYVTRIRNSVFTESLASFDVTDTSNAATIYLYSNQIDELNNQGTIYSDGTNDIVTSFGNSLNTLSRK